MFRDYLVDCIIRYSYFFFSRLSESTHKYILYIKRNKPLLYTLLQRVYIHTWVYIITLILIRSVYTQKFYNKTSGNHFTGVFVRTKLFECTREIILQFKVRNLLRNVTFSAVPKRAMPSDDGNRVWWFLNKQTCEPSMCRNRFQLNFKTITLVGFFVHSRTRRSESLWYTCTVVYTVNVLRERMNGARRNTFLNARVYRRTRDGIVVNLHSS